MSDRSTSDPATNRKNSIPIRMKSVRVLVTRSVDPKIQSKTSGAIAPSTVTPMMTPAAISPTTDG